MAWTMPVPDCCDSFRHAAAETTCTVHIRVFDLNLYVFYNPFNYGVAAPIAGFLRGCYPLYGKMNKLFSKKIAAICVAPRAPVRVAIIGGRRHDLARNPMPAEASDPYSDRRRARQGPGRGMKQCGTCPPRDIWRSGSMRDSCCVSVNGPRLSISPHLCISESDTSSD
jgi:hypothetical protein